MKDIIISGVNICLAIFTLTLNWKISTRDYQKKEEEKKEKKTNLRLNIIKMMEYNSSILVKCFKHPMRSGEVLNDLIILKGYTERLIILDEEFKNSVNVLYTYFLKIEKKEVDSFCLFEKKYTKFLKFIPEEEAYYFLEKKYRDVLLKLKSEKNKYITAENEGERIKIKTNLIDVDTYIDKNGNETGKTLYRDISKDYLFKGYMEKGIIIKGEIITKNYKFNGEIKDNLPYNGEIKDVKEIILESYDKNYKVKEFEGLIKEGKAYSGTGKIESRIDYGIIIDSERLEDQNQEYFKEDVYIEDEIPKEVKEEIYLNEKYEDLKRRYDFILVESKLYLKDGIVLKTEEYNYHGMSEINSWKYEFIG